MGRGIDLSLPIDPTDGAALLARLRTKTRCEMHRDDLGECWVWIGYLRNGKHGALSVHDRPVYVHQISYALHHGPISSGLVICHRCDIPACWRPDHLFGGTQHDNVRDMETKGRARKVCPRGLRNASAYLSEDQVAEIRALWVAGVAQRRIARRFGCTQSTVWRIAHRVTRALPAQETAHP